MGRREEKRRNEGERRGEQGNKGRELGDKRIHKRKRCGSYVGEKGGI